MGPKEKIKPENSQEIIETILIISGILMYMLYLVNLYGFVTVKMYFQ